MPDREQEEPRRSDPLPGSIFSRKSIDFQAKHSAAMKEEIWKLEA